MTNTDTPHLKPASPPNKWWRPLSDGMSGGFGSIGRAVGDASDRILLSARELNHALQFQLFYARREVERSKSSFGRFLNFLSGGDVGYLNFPALHSAQVLELAGYAPKPVVLYHTRWLIRMDVAEAALAEIRKRDAQ